MPEDTAQYFERLRGLNVYRSGERRAPHKPLLLLLAIARLLRGESRLAFSEVEAALVPLLQTYAPPVKARHQPELPYWHLRGDRLWELPGAGEFQLQSGGFPRMGALRSSFGRLEPGFAKRLLSDPDFVKGAVQLLLEEHFPESVHDDILGAVDLRLPQPDRVADAAAESSGVRRRDPRFRRDVLRAYEHRCALTGFRAALGGTYVGCEAAHIQWHAYAGPDTVKNGLAVEPTLHKLLDTGAWTLTDDRRVLVSAELTGTDETVERIRSLQGKQVRSPIEGAPPVAMEYIRWHREPELGGVFRHPALPL